MFLVDDHALFRAGVRAELGAPVDVVGEAGTVDEAIAGIIGDVEPDVVLLDVHMPDGGGAGGDRGVRAETTRRRGSSRCRCPTPPRT